LLLIARLICYLHWQSKLATLTGNRYCIARTVCACCKFAYALHLLFRMRCAIQNKVCYPDQGVLSTMKCAIQHEVCYPNGVCYPVCYPNEVCYPRVSYPKGGVLSGVLSKMRCAIQNKVCYPKSGVLYKIRCAIHNEVCFTCAIRVGESK
jgi:hypothetical protein